MSKSILSCLLKLPAMEEIYASFNNGFKKFFDEKLPLGLPLWACFTRSTWVTSANFHLITDVLSQNTEYLGLKTRALQTQVHMEHFFWQGP